MDIKLTRMILIDSYCAGRISEIELDGHITLNGGNGAGKTTLLRLLPMFLGEQPSQIIRGDSVVNNFGHYYFPRATSYLVFEYLRPYPEQADRKVLAVIHADRKDDKVAYRFIESEYRPELFMDGDSFVQSGVLYRHLDKLNIPDSKPLSLHAYRNILHNTAGREHRALASRFSFTSGKGKLTHIERVVTGILQKATTFHDLKRMVVSSVLDNAEDFSLRTGKKDLALWIDEHEAHVALMKKAPVMDALEKADAQRLTHEQEFAKLHAKFKVLLDHLDGEIQTTEKRKSDLTAEKQSTELAFENQIRQLSDLKIEAESKAKQAQADLNQLDKRKAEFSKNNAETLAASVDAIPRLTEEIRNLQTQRIALEGEASTLTQVFKDQASAAQALAKQYLGDLSAGQNQAKQDHATATASLADKAKNDRKTLTDNHVLEIQAVDGVATELRIQEKGLLVEVQKAQASPEALETLSAASAAQQEANALVATLLEGKEALTQARQEAKDAFDTLETQIRAGASALTGTQDELETLRMAANPSETTLLGFLRLNLPGWEENIGRILPEETLLREDLSPELSQGSDFYGISLDLEKLEASRFAIEAEIQRGIQLLQTRLQKQQIDLDALNKALLEKQAGMTKANAEAQAHDAKISVAKNAQIAANTRVRTAETQVNDSKKAAQALAQSRLTSCQEQVEKAISNTKTCRAAHNAALSGLDTDYAQAVKLLQDDLDTRLKAMQHQMDTITDELVKTLEQNRKDQADCLQKNGIDPANTQKLSQQMDARNQLIEAAAAQIGYVAEYRGWLKSTWAHRDARVQDAQQAHDVAKKKTQDLTQLQNTRDAAILQKQTELVTVQHTLTGLEETQKTVRYQLPSFAAWPMDPDVLQAGFEPQLQVETLVSQRKYLQTEIEANREQIRRGVEDIRRQMTLVPGTGPDKFHTNAFGSLGYPRPGREHEWLEVFRNWFRNEHISHQASLQQMGHTMAQNIDAFWKTLVDFQKNVSNFATELRSNLEQGTVFANISDISVVIEAEVDTQGYWTAVENLHHEFDAWHAQGTAAPPSSFVDAAKRVAEVLDSDTGLVADPVDLLHLTVSAKVNGERSRTAKNEHELAKMSSTGLAYLILCVILIGFVNRIRRKERVTIPFVVDELKDLEYANAKTLLELLEQNNIIMISAFPDVDVDLAVLFKRNYKVLPERKIGLVDPDDLREMEKDYV